MTRQRTAQSQEKACQRARWTSWRESLPASEVAAASHAICLKLSTWPLLRGGSVAMAYLAFRNEIDLSEAHRLLPDVLWTVPRIQGKRLIAHPYHPDRLIRHRFGMLEPDPDLPVVPPQQLNVVLIPGLAFARNGSRLGFGGGYYDRFLPTTPAVRVGIAHDACVVDALPHESFDQRIDWIATPTRMIACVPAAAGPALGR